MTISWQFTYNGESLFTVQWRLSGIDSYRNMFCLAGFILLNASVFRIMTIPCTINNFNLLWILKPFFKKKRIKPCLGRMSCVLFLFVSITAFYAPLKNRTAFQWYRASRDRRNCKHNMSHGRIFSSLKSFFV